MRGDVLLALGRRPRHGLQLGLGGLRLRDAARLQRRYPLEVVFPRLKAGLEAAAVYSEFSLLRLVSQEKCGIK